MWTEAIQKKKQVKYKKHGIISTPHVWDKESESVRPVHGRS